MIEREFGRVINIGSDAGRVGSSLESVYSGAKGGIIAFTKTLAREVATKGITVGAWLGGEAEHASVRAKFLDSYPERVRGSPGPRTMTPLVGGAAPRSQPRPGAPPAPPGGNGRRERDHRPNASRRLAPVRGL